MPLSRERILADGVTPHPWEREGIEFLKSVVPDTEPYRLWALVDLIEPSGRRHEIDAIVLGYNALYLLELKAHPCRFSGNGVDWTIQWPDDHRTSMESPVTSITRKARVLAGLLDKELRGRIARPRVEALVFLSNERADVSGLDAIGRLGVVTRADVARAITHGEFNGALSSLRERSILSPVVRETVLALKRLNVMGSRAALKINDILVKDLVDEGAGFQDHAGEHEKLKTPSRVRFYLVPQASSEEQKERLTRAATREARILLELTHPNVLRCREFVSSGPTGGPALVFDHHADFERLDQFVRTRPDLSFADRLAIVQHVGEALAYCHSKEVMHRGLEPSSVLVRRVESTVEGRKQSSLDVKIFNFQLAHSATSDGTAHVGAIGDSAAYRAPELLGDPTRAREPSDVFSLGALAWFVFVGRAPVKDLVEQHEVLVRDGCYSLAVASDALVSLGGKSGAALERSRDLDELVRFATAREVGARCTSVTDFLNLLLEVRPDAEQQRPIVDAQPGDVLEADDKTKVEIVKLLGSGASSKVFRARLDNGVFAVKVALDRAQDERLEAESDLLERVQGDRIVRRHRKLRFDRRLVLVLDDAGETLADVIASRGALPLSDAQRWGEHLLLAVERLEELGVVHKDIKPANLGVSSSASGKSTHARLFDFSLAAEPVERVEVGTPAYRDPLLFLRKRWDHAADRYSAAMTLYEMLTATRVRWGRDDVVIGSSDEATIESDRFDASVREELTAFFKRCFAREVGARFASGEEMRMAWLELFARRGGAAAEASGRDGEAATSEPAATKRKKKGEPQWRWTDAELDALSKRSSIEALPLSTRARNALDRAGMLTLQELLQSSKAKLQALDGVGHDTLREIVALRDAFRARPGASSTSANAMPAVTPAEPTSLERLGACCDALVPDPRSVKKKWLHAMHALFGLGEGQSPTDARSLAAAQGVSRQAVYIQLQQARAFWREHPLHEPLTVRVLDLLAQRGDVATVEQLAVDLAFSFGEPVDDRGGLPWRQARALVEIVRHTATQGVAMDESHEELRLLWDAVVNDMQWVATDRALLEPLRALGGVADELARREVLASAEEARVELVARVADTPLARWSADRLLALAAEASKAAACSARLELYPKGMAAGKALRLCSGVLGERAVDEPRLRATVKSRYPWAEELPRGEALERMVSRELDLTFDRGRAVFERVRVADASSATVISQVAEVRARVLPQPIAPSRASALASVRPLASDDPAAIEFDERVRVAARRGTFRVVETDAPYAPVVSRALALRLGSTERSLDRALWASMQAIAANEGIEWDAVITADREGPSGEAWPLLRGLALDAARSLLREWRGSSAAIVLRDLGLAARYALREFVEGLVELARADDGPAVFLVLARMQDQGEAPIDGGVLPGLSVPNPFAVPRMHPPSAWWRAVG